VQMWPCRRAAVSTLCTIVQMRKTGLTIVGTAKAHLQTVGPSRQQARQALRLVPSQRSSSICMAGWTGCTLTHAEYMRLSRWRK
jgi:hypothetical protein